MLEDNGPTRFSNNRALWMVVGIGLLWWSWQLMGRSALTWTVPFLVVGNLWGILTILVSWLPSAPWGLGDKWVTRFEWATAIFTTAVFVVWGVTSTGGVEAYGTDAMAFDQYAAHLLMHGMNPYAQSMRPAFELFHTPTSFYTYMFNGRPVTSLSYPAQSFLLYIPFLAIGWTQNLAPLINVFAWGLTMLLMFALAPRNLRPVAVLLGGFSVFAVFAIGGVTDVLFMPLLVLAAYRWDRFGSSRLTYLAPILFGTAMGIKQTPWPAMPFVLLALCLDESARTDLKSGLKRAGRYAGIAFVAFIIPNLPFLILSPSTWFKGTFTPLFANMVPTGQGSISLSLYLHLGGGSIDAYTAAAVLVLGFLVVAFIATYPLLRGGMYLLPAIAFFFADRSNMNYFISLIPIGFIAASTSEQKVAWMRSGVGLAVSAGAGIRARASRLLDRCFRSRRWGIATTVMAFLSITAIAYSMAAPQPLRIRIIGMETTGAFTHIEQLTLSVTNNSGQSVHPAFDILRGGYNSTFWHVQGPRKLAGGATAKYVLNDPNNNAEPSIYGGFSVIGYLNSPKSFSVSPVYNPNLYHLGFYPSAVNSVLKINRPFTLRVQVFQRSGGVLNQAGIRVRLGQAVWTNTRIARGSSRIDGRQRGQRAFAYTNSHGVATFTIVGKRPTPYPINYTASLYNAKYHFIYSDSGSIGIRFK